MKRVMRLWDIVFINITAIIGIRWIPIAAAYGASAIMLWVLAALLLFIPLGLISTELATTWPDQGGMYIWVREAFGKRAGFLVSWFYWANSFFYCPGLLIFVAVTIAFIINPALEQNKLFVCGFSIGFLWLVTFISMRSMDSFKKLANLAGVWGTLIPGLILILLGFGAVFIWGKPIATDYSFVHWMPDLSSKSNIAFLATLMFSMAGIELTPIMAGETENPQKTFPRATFISAILIVGIYIIGTVAVTLIISPEKIGAASGINDALQLVTKELNVPFLAMVVAAMLILGNIGGIGIWIVAPIKMLFESCKAEDGAETLLPKFFTKCNKNDMPANALLVQASIVTFVIIGTSFLPSVNVFYETLILMATITYFIPYVVMFFAFFKLRAKYPDKNRPYRVPGGKFGSSLIAGFGLSAVILAIILPFLLPPNDIQGMNALLIYRIELGIGPIFFWFLGYLIYKFYNNKTVHLKEN